MKRADIVNYKTLVRARPLTDRELQLVGDKGYVLCGVAIHDQVNEGPKRWWGLGTPHRATKRLYHYHFTVPASS